MGIFRGIKYIVIITNCILPIICIIYSIYFMQKWNRVGLFNLCGSSVHQRARCPWDGEWLPWNTSVAKHRYRPTTAHAASSATLVFYLKNVSGNDSHESFIWFSQTRTCIKRTMPVSPMRLYLLSKGAIGNLSLCIHASSKCKHI